MFLPGQRSPGYANSEKAGSSLLPLPEPPLPAPPPLPPLAPFLVPGGWWCWGWQRAQRSAPAGSRQRQQEGGGAACGMAHRPCSPGRRACCQPRCHPEAAVPQLTLASPLASQASTSSSLRDSSPAPPRLAYSRMPAAPRAAYTRFSERGAGTALGRAAPQQGGRAQPPQLPPRPHLWLRWVSRPAPRPALPCPHPARSCGWSEGRRTGWRRSRGTSHQSAAARPSRCA